MMRLNYGAFEETVRMHMTPRMERYKFAEILLSSPLIDADVPGKEFLRAQCNFDKGLITKYCTGERNIPKHILENHFKTNAREYIETCFSVEIIPFILGGDNEKLLQKLSEIIQNDDTLPENVKANLEMVAANKNLSIFLTETYLCAINSKVEEETIVTNLPRQNQFFCGREELLTVICTRYMEGIHVQTLYGLGGVGKTQIALQYAYTHLREYDIIWWIDAESKISIHNSISKLLSMLKCLPKSKDIGSVQKAFLKYLKKHSNWLLIYDNAEYGTDEEYDVLLAYTPQTPNGHILLTTRCANTFENAAQAEIQVFGIAESVNFLQLRSRLKDRLNAAKVAEQLGYLPLALEYAAAYIRETKGVDYVVYSKKLKQYSVKLLDRKVGYLSYKNTVRQAFHVTLDKILEKAATDRIYKSVEQTLYICAYLAPDEIAIRLFSFDMKHPEFFYAAIRPLCNINLPEPIKSVLKNELDRDELFRIIEKYSLLRINNDKLSMHRLLQEVLLDEIESPEDGLHWMKHAYGLCLDYVHPFNMLDVEDVSAHLAQAFPHMQNIIFKSIEFHEKLNIRMSNFRQLLIGENYLVAIKCALFRDREKPSTKSVAQIKDDISFLHSAIETYRRLPNNSRNIGLVGTIQLLAERYEWIRDYSSATNQYYEAAAILRRAISDIPSYPHECYTSLYYSAFKACHLGIKFASAHNQPILMNIYIAEEEQLRALAGH